MTKARDLADLNFASPELTGVPIAPTAAAGTDSTQIATTAFVSTEVAGIVDTAPATLDTLNELAAALGDDANFSTTVTNNIATKAPLASPTFTGTATIPTLNSTTAIQMGGTEVLNSSRQLSNIASIDATTATAISAAGVGGGGTADFVASGAISTGEIVSINSDGTVSVAYATGLGNNVNYTSGDIDGSGRIASVYDTNSNKVVIIYNDTSNNNYLTASVGTVSGTSISFGTKVQIDTERANYMAATFDSNSNKVIIAIQKVSNSQGAIYGCTVSGTSITKNSTDIFYSGQPQYVGATFDSLNNKVVVTFRDDGNTPKVGKAVVCTVNASSISVGTPVAFSSNSVEYTQAIFDTNSNKVVIAWTDQNGSDRGVAVVGTVSGTSISFGSFVEYDSASAYWNRLAFDSTNNKIIIVWRDNSLNQNRAIVATVSGTSISYGTAAQAFVPYTSEFNVTYDANAQKVVAVYSDGNNTSNATVTTGTVDGTDISFSDDTYAAQTGTDGSNTHTIVYDPDQQRSVIAFRNFESTNFGTAAVFTVGNGDKFIGLATENVSDTATGTFTVIGGINENQTGLSTSLNYYLSNTTDGALSSSPNTGIKIGRAISATKILVTGNA